MEVTAKYNNEKTKVVTDYEITNGENLPLEKTEVTISYTENGVTKTTAITNKANPTSIPIMQREN